MSKFKKKKNRDELVLLDAPRDIKIEWEPRVQQAHEDAWNRFCASRAFTVMNLISGESRDVPPGTTLDEFKSTIKEIE